MSRFAQAHPPVRKIITDFLARLLRTATIQTKQQQVRLPKRDFDKVLGGWKEQLHFSLPASFQVLESDVLQRGMLPKQRDRMAKLRDKKKREDATKATTSHDLSCDWPPCIHTLDSQYFDGDEKRGAPMPKIITCNQLAIGTVLKRCSSPFCLR
jgi:hypothetical protein